MGARRQWEYKIVTIDRIGITTAMIEAVINVEGVSGWELVAVTSRAPDPIAGIRGMTIIVWFKRPRPMRAKGAK